MIGTSEHGGTPDMARNTRNTRLFLYLPLLSVAFSAFALFISQLSPARAQSPFLTPTPLPSISATATAAAQRTDAANAALQQAAQLEAQAAELRRNGEAQQAEAQQAINDARAAGAAQSAAAFGEAIGRAVGALDEMSKTNAAQANLIDSLRDKIEEQAATIISDTNELQQERAAHQTIATAYNVTQQQLSEAQKQSASTPIVVYVFAIGFFAILAVLIVVVLQRKRAIEPSAPRIIEPGAARNEAEDEDVIEGDTK